MTPSPGSIPPVPQPNHNDTEHPASYLIRTQPSIHGAPQMPQLSFAPAHPLPRNPIKSPASAGGIALPPPFSKKQYVPTMPISSRTYSITGSDGVESAQVVAVAELQRESGHLNPKKLQI